MKKKNLYKIYFKDSDGALTKKIVKAYTKEEAKTIKKNTVKCCSSCNSSKGAKDVLVWLSEKGMKPSKKILNLVKNSEDKL